MKIVHVASELFPYVKTGGLADAVAALSRSLGTFGHDVAVFLPGYRQVLDHPDLAGIQTRMTLGVEMDDVSFRGELLEQTIPGKPTLYVIRRDECFDRSHPYGRSGRDYEDNAERFLFFSKAVVEAIGRLRLRPDIVHCHDWQTALVPLLLRADESRRGSFTAGKTILTIHNLAFQGIFPMRYFPMTGLPDELRGVDGLEFYGQINFLKGGILYSDRVTTVSPTYGREILTPGFGCGLEGVLAARKEDLFCQTNGIDIEVWNPETDSYLPFNYNLDDLSGKAKCRRFLLKELGLEAGTTGPVYGMICRLTAQKGLDILEDVLSFFVENDCRLVVLGSGGAEYESRMRDFASRHPGRVSVNIRLDERLSHLIEAGADFLLMPSTFEPCGLNQLYSMRYGTVPLASRVGGLADTVIDLDEAPDRGTGLSFPPESTAFRDALERSLRLYRNPKRMRRLIDRLMRLDYSWEEAARNYERLYEEVL